MQLRQRIFWRLCRTWGLISLGIIAPVGLLLWLAGWGTAAQILLWCLITLTVLLVASLGSALVVAGRGAPAISGFEESLEQVAAGRYAPELSRESRETFEELATAFDQMTQHVRTSSREMLQDRDRLRTVINSMIEGVVAIDPGQKITLINSAACTLFNLRESGAVGRPLWEVLRNPQIHDWVNQSLDHRQRTGGELKLRTTPPRALMVNVSPFPAERGYAASGPSGAVLVIADVTELRRLESVRQEFFANASHELKTPLAAIKGCVETLLDSGAADDTPIRERFLQMIDEHAERLDVLIQDMLALSRIESESRTLQTHPLSVGESIRRCLSRHEQGVQRRKLNLVHEGNLGDLQILGDEEAFEEILDNLIDNAIKYTNEGGTITVRAREEAEECVVEVQDTGIGIPTVHLARIFERFYRVDRHRSRDQGGSGLGLAIVKHLVQSLGGKILVESQVNSGTTFQLRLPLTSQNTHSEASAQHSP
ncbi:MAG: ATP-binding protein [Planctomycetales bacterium]